jgi:hypothetical protein
MPKKLTNILSRVPASDAFWLAGAVLVAVGAGIERLSAGLIVGGILLLAVGVGSVTRAR